MTTPRRGDFRQFFNEDATARRCTPRAKHRSARRAVSGKTAAHRADINAIISAVRARLLGAFPLRNGSARSDSILSVDTAIDRSMDNRSLKYRIPRQALRGDKENQRSKLIRGTHATAPTRVKKSANLKSSEDLARARARAIEPRTVLELTHDLRPSRGVAAAGSRGAAGRCLARGRAPHDLCDSRWAREWNCFPMAGK